MQDNKRELAEAMVDAHNGAGGSRKAGSEESGLARLSAEQTLSLFDE